MGELSFAASPFAVELVSSRFTYDEQHAAFINIPTKEQYDLALKSMPGFCVCFCCSIEETKVFTHGFRKVNNGFSFQDVTYHRHEFVYIRPIDVNDNLLEIGQIIELTNDKRDQMRVRVRLLGRYDDYVRARHKNSPQTSQELISDEVCILDVRNLFVCQCSCSSAASF